MVSYRYFKNGKINLLVNNILIGALTIFDLDKPSAYIQNIDVKSRYQNKGYGSMLLNKAIEQLTTQESVSLYVAIENEKAMRFYRRHGFFIVLYVKKKGKKAHYLMTNPLIRIN